MKRPSFWLAALLLFALLGLQYRFWFGDGGVSQRMELERQIQLQQAENQRLLRRNRLLEAEVLELKQGMETVEERARHELGMVKKGETLYLLME